MGGEPKQFRRLGGRPTLCWAARGLAEALGGPIAVVVSRERVEEAERALATHLPELADRTRIAVGGDRRRDSVWSGLEALTGEGTVLIHDASRPFASPGLVERVAWRAKEGRAVVPALPVRDTLKEIDGEGVVRTLARERVVAAQTPQGFPRNVLREAHEASDEDAPDDAALCERLGIPVTWVRGEALNRKLTDPEDWDWAEVVIASGRLRWR